MLDGKFMNAGHLCHFICAGCMKKIGGGFVQPDEKILCASCVIEKVDKGSHLFAAQKALFLCEKALDLTRFRQKIKISDMRSIHSWLKILVDRLEKDGKDFSHDSRKKINQDQIQAGNSQS